MNCGHAMLTFGCDGCIKKNKLAVLEEAKRTMSAPKCPECGRDTVLYDVCPTTMTLSFICDCPYTEDGPVCDGEVDVKIT